MSVTSPAPSPTVTEHALLVPLGRFAQHIGLVDALGRVPFTMKTVQHSPGDKLTELLIHILAGGMHVKELDGSPHALVRDQAVARAWGQDVFASASGVSDLLRSASPEIVTSLTTELRHVTEPYRRRLLRELPSSWVVDFDLTGLVVGDQALTYEGADYGYMGEVNGVAKGYQFARAQLVGRRDVLVLGGFLHPGRTVPLHCLRELVLLVEAEVGKPRRRVEVIEARLEQANQDLAAIEHALADRAGSPAKVQRRCKRLEAQRERKHEEISQLQARREALAADNASNPNPRRIILRLDGGFGDAEHLAWLYEEGYDFVARVHNHRVAASLRTEEGLRWEKVSKNAFIAESTRTTLGHSPYPVRLFACRQWWGSEKPERWSALTVNPELEPSDWPVRRVGVFYNARQIMEAGIKEGKGIFASRHLPTRHQAGIALYQELVLLAQNLIRWFRRQLLRRTALARTGVKDLIRLAANSRALVVTTEGALVLQFSAEGPWPSLTLSLRPQISYQLWLPVLDDCWVAQAGP
jgi:hypothetical protein